MEVNQLRSFRAIYEEKSYTKAAERLFISRQALQHMVRSMEQEYGTPLFVRGARGIEPSPFAGKLYESSGRVLEAWDEMEQTLEKLGQKRSLSIAVPSGINASCTQKEMNACLNARYPFQIKYTVCGELEAERQLLAGEVDMAYMTIPGEERPELEYYELSRGELYLLAGKGGPFDGETAVSVAVLKDHSLIAQGTDYGGFCLLEAACREHGFALRPAFCTPDWYTIFGQLSAGAVSYYPRDLTGAKEFPEALTIPFRENIRWRMGIVYRKENQRDALVSQYLKTVKKNRKEM